MNINILTNIIIMDSSFDLDIHNYTPNDLIKFFKLEQSYTLNDLVGKVAELTKEILSPNNTSYKTTYKNDIIKFISEARDVLSLFKKEAETNNAIKENLDKFVNMNKDRRVGQIINPLDTHPVLETASNPTESINGYDYVVNNSVYVFNTAGRNDYFLSESSNATFDLPLKWRNVLSVSLVSANIPNVMYAFNDESVTNQLYIEEDGTGLSGVVVLPQGNYSPYEIPTSGFIPLNALIEASFPDELTKVINEQILGIFTPANYRFKVTVSLSTRETTITNNTHTFTMNTIRRLPRENCKYSSYSSLVYNDYTDLDPPPDKTQIPFLSYIQTMGYLMGFRETYYTGKTSYISESIFTNIYSNYLFFELDDYTGSQPASSTYGILGSSVINSNVLGVIPINSSLFTTTFDNNSNFIYKKREYFGPVDISRITIKLVNQKGNIVNLHKTDYSFSLQIRSLYNLTNTGRGLRAPGIF
jgi:hypothetical protein